MACGCNGFCAVLQQLRFDRYFCSIRGIRETEVAQEAISEQMVEKSEEELIAETTSDPSLAIEIEQGAAFDVQKDFTGLGLKDGDKAELKKSSYGGRNQF